MNKANSKTIVVLKLIMLFSLQIPFAAFSAEKPAYPFPEHIDQFTIKNHPPEVVYEWGEMLFDTHFNAIDGVGTNLKNDPPDAISKRFTRSPRADLPGWISNPIRPDGPQAQSCIECHGERTGNVLNEERDPLRSGQIKNYIDRQATNLSGIGALQLLAEQTSRELWAIRDKAISDSATTGKSVRRELLSSNRVSYGYITANPDGTLDLSEVEGVDTENDPQTRSQQLRVAPLHLKGVAAFIRQFSSATDITLGLQSPERFPEFIDVDNDGVVEELSVGDMTALTIYMAGIARPVTLLELNTYIGGEFRLSHQEVQNIREGGELFKTIGCADCHKPRLRLQDTIFREPSSTPGFYFPSFWATWINPETGQLGGGNPLDYGYNIHNPYEFDIANNPAIKCRMDENSRSMARIQTAFTKKVVAEEENTYSEGCWRQYRRNSNGTVVIELYGDQKRHDMGSGLAEDIDEFSKGPSVWRTKELWGVASTAPWLHDGRATTLTEAIKWHGGEAAKVRDNYFALSENQQEQVLDFLKNLVIYDFDRGIILNSDNYDIWSK